MPTKTTVTLRFCIYSRDFSTLARCQTTKFCPRCARDWRTSISGPPPANNNVRDCSVLLLHCCCCSHCYWRTRARERSGAIFKNFDLCATGTQRPTINPTPTTTECIWRLHFCQRKVHRLPGALVVPLARARARAPVRLASERNQRWPTNTQRSTWNTHTENYFAVLWRPE